MVIIGRPAALDSPMGNLVAELRRALSGIPGNRTQA
jgi:hypothetical protein